MSNATIETPFIPNHWDITRIAFSLHPKYSHNLHQMLAARTNRTVAEFGRVYRASKDGHLWLGYIDDVFFVGFKIMDILCNGRRATRGSYSITAIGELNEVTSFWDDYLTTGRCAIDTAHTLPMLNSETRFKVSAKDTRRCCNWCGQKATLRTRIVKTRRSRWEAISPNAKNPS